MEKLVLLIAACAVAILAICTIGRAQKPELVVQTGHIEAINSIAFSPDGQLLASVGEDKKTIIWEVRTGKELRTQRSSSQVKTVAFSHSGTNLVTGTEDRTVDIFEISSERVLRTLKGHVAAISYVAFSADDKKIISEDTAGTVKVWDFETGENLLTIQNELQDSRHAFAVSRDEKLFASVGKNNQLRLWNAETGAEMSSLKDPGFVTAIDFSPDGRTIAATTSDGKVTLWDIANQKDPQTFDFEVFMNASLVFSPDGKSLAAAASINGEIRLWDLASGRFRTLKGPGLEISCLAFAPDGKTIAAGYTDPADIDTKQSKEIQLWDTATGQRLKSLTGRSRANFSVAFDHSTGTIAAAGEDNTVKLWDIRAGGRLRTLSGHTNSVTSVAFGPDDQLLASASLDGTIKLWNASTGKQVATFSEVTHDTSGSATNLPGETDSAMVWYVSFSADGKHLMSFTEEQFHGHVTIWEVMTGRVVRRIDDGEFKSADNESVFLQAAAFSPNGQFVVAATRNTIKIWDLQVDKVINTITTEDIEVGPIVFSHDSKSFATAHSQNKTIKIWDVRTGTTARTLATDLHPLLFNRDGKVLVCVENEQRDSITLLDAISGKVISVLKGHQAAVVAVAFSPDEKYLCSGSFDTALKVWDLSTGQELATLISFDQKEWVVVTPDALFDGSPSAWTSISWRFSRSLYDFAPVEAFFNEFYHPDLLTEIFSGQRPKLTQNISQKDRRQPNLVLSSTGNQVDAIKIRNVDLEIEVSEIPADKSHKESTGSQDLRLFRNGSLVNLWPGDTFAIQSKCKQLVGKTTEPRRAVCKTTVTIGAGSNIFTAYAFNHDNVKSNDAELTINGAESLKRSGTAYIIAVGINQYANKNYNLSYAVPDAEDFAAEIKRQQESLQQYEKVEGIPLLNHDATKGNILLALQRLSGSDESPAGALAVLKRIKKAEPEDLVMVYFAGHGMAQDNQFYLIPHNLGYESTQKISNAEALKLVRAHSISDKDLQGAFEKVDAGHLLLVIDACNSGQLLEAEEKRRGPMNSKGLAQLAYEKGMYILTASQSFQAAQEVSELQHGLLTFVLVEEGLKLAKAEKNEKGEITERKWLDYATLRVPEKQVEKMKQRELEIGVNKKRPPGRKAKSRAGLFFVEGDNAKAKPDDRRVQRPRVFYRRELEKTPLIVAK